MAKPRSPEPTYSMRLLLPFVDLLRGRIPDESVKALKAIDPDAHIPISLVLKWLEDSVALTGDPDLGLKAARLAAQGDYDLLEYAMVSSETVRDANEVMRRYVKLVNSALDYSLEIQGERAISRLSSRVPLSRAAADFQLAALYSASRRWLPAPPDAYSEIWLTYPEPGDTTEHARAFPGSKVCFGAPFDAIVFDRKYLNLRMPHADPKLHALLRRQIEERVAELPPAQELRKQVRKLIVAELAGGNPSADHVADCLQMSRRTLTRRLLQQGTTFKALLEEVRREVAVRALISEEIGIAGIAERLGFAEAAAFHRAFKRWTGMTPAEYRERNWRGPQGLE
jgi:AraC-like DNA-binding protein